MKVLEDPQLEVKRKLPWLIDVFLYPANLNGIVYIGIFLFLSFLIVLLDKLLLLAGSYGGIISGLAKLLFIGYIFYYSTYCIFDSSKGNTRAPAIAMEHTPDRGDLISQIFLILGSIAICFCWPAVYYIFIRQTDWIFWMLGVCGAFFFPMALLAGVLFDAFNALNPVFIIGSILRSFLSYCGLILSYCAFGGLVAVISLALRYLPSVLSFVSYGVYLYLSFVAAHLLGRFYWQNKDRLDWGI